MKNRFLILFFIFTFISYCHSQNFLEPISPGFISPPGEAIQTLTPKLEWNKISGATEYQVYISEKLGTGEYKLIYKSSELLKINSNNFKVPFGILKYNKSYRWNFRAKINNTWTSTSERLYFTTHTNEFYEDSLERKTHTEAGQVIKTLIPILRWEKVETAEGYQIEIEKKTNRNEYELIYKTPDEKIIIDNFFEVPIGLLQTGIQYRWKVRSYNRYGWSSYSRYSYFQIDKTNQPQTPILQKEEKSFSTLTPVLYWSKVSSAEGYGIYLFKILSANKAELIFSTSDSNLVRDTFFTIPKSLLEYGNRYFGFIKS
ncbi:MAG: hypothetical protein N3A61_02415, partial [Ignavibacteria bacterium]|nr:hypothetical protein [Ignavibacteria bacterium]